MLPSESDMGFNGPSSEESHPPLELRTSTDQPIVSDHQLFHDPDAPFSTYFEDALPSFDEPSDQSLIPLSTVPTHFTPFSTLSSLTEYPPANAHDPIVKMIDLYIPKEESSAMDSIIRGDLGSSANENYPMETITAEPPTLYPMQVPSFPRSKASSLAMPSFDLTPQSEVTTFAVPNFDTVPGSEATIAGTSRFNPVPRSETMPLATPNFTPMIPVSGLPSSGESRKLIQAPGSLTKATGTRRRLPSDVEMAKLLASTPRPSNLDSRQPLNCTERKPCRKCANVKMSTWMHKYEQGILLANRCGYDFGIDDFRCLSDCFFAMCDLFVLKKVTMLGDEYLNPEKRNQQNLKDRITKEMFGSIGFVSQLGNDFNRNPNLVMLLEAQMTGAFYRDSKSSSQLLLPSLVQIVGEGVYGEPLISWKPVHFVTNSITHEGTKPKAQSIQKG
ncbi:hypothetical protein PG984_008200 [Apiospora sp. TS-2023a]